MNCVLLYSISPSGMEGSVMRRPSIAFFCLLLVVLTLACTSQVAWSQEVTAAIVGTVADPSGAPIKGAKVTATDTARGTPYVSETNDSGAYNINRIPVGTYELKVSAAGFQTAVHAAFTLVLNQTARVDVQMKVGQVSETVEGPRPAPVLQAGRGGVSPLTAPQPTAPLPLATRNYVQ